MDIELRKLLCNVARAVLKTFDEDYTSEPFANAPRRPRTIGDALDEVRRAQPARRATDAQQAREILAKAKADRDAALKADEPTKPKRRAKVAPSAAPEAVSKPDKPARPAKVPRPPKAPKEAKPPKPPKVEAPPMPFKKGDTVRFFHVKKNRVTTAEVVAFLRGGEFVKLKEAPAAGKKNSKVHKVLIGKCTLYSKGGEAPAAVPS